MTCDKTAVRLTRVEDYPNATGILYELIKERTAEESISHKELPSYYEHSCYVASHPYRYWWIVTNIDGVPVGMIFATHNNELGIAISPHYRRRGYAKAAILKVTTATLPKPAVKGVRDARWLANISPKNHASMQLFRSLGFNHIQNTLSLAPEEAKS